MVWVEEMGFFSYIFEAWLQRVLGEERLNGLKARVARDSSLMLFPHFFMDNTFRTTKFPDSCDYCNFG